MALRGLTVSPAGRVLLDGAPFRNIGLNYGGAVQRIYRQLSPSACEYTPAVEQDAALDVAARCGSRVLRVKATPFWPAQWLHGLNAGKSWATATAADREAHYRRIDAFLAKCQARDVGVILTLFFRHASVPDLVGEPVRAWLTPGSATRSFATTLTQEIVARYLDHPAVYGYEWSNEVNHYNDASDATRGSFPAISVGFGTPASYSATTDMFSGGELASVLSWWYGVVRAIDSQRIVMSGNGPNSYSQPGGVPGIRQPIRAWYEEQIRDNPLNTVTIHWYGNVGYGAANFAGLESILAGTNHWSRLVGRALIVGEFGNQPWPLFSVSAAQGDVTFLTAEALPIAVGDDFDVLGTGRFDGRYVVDSLNAARSEIRARAAVPDGAWSGVASVRHMTPNKLRAVCGDLRRAEVDVALFWQVDLDPMCPPHESIVGDEGQILAIASANRRLRSAE